MTILNKVILLYILDSVILRIIRSEKKMCFVGYSEVGDEVRKHKGPQMFEKTAVYVQLYSYI